MYLIVNKYLMFIMYFSEIVNLYLYISIIFVNNRNHSLVLNGAFNYFNNLYKLNQYC